MIGALRYRSRDLVEAILSTVYADDDPTSWPDLVEAFTSPKHDRKTVDGTLRDLCRYGALERVGHYTSGDDTRAVRATVLGRWHDRRRDLLDLEDDETLE